MHLRRLRDLCFAVLPLLASAAPAAQAQAGGSIFVTPIPNAQFSAIVHVERTDARPNGSAVQLWSERQIARDYSGRIHNENRTYVLANTSFVPRVTVIHLYDPQSRMNEFVYPQQKAYRANILNRPPTTDTPDDFASRTALSAPSSAFTRQEDLGDRTIAGLKAHGERVTQTLPAAQSGTGQDVFVTDEYWYSDTLRINLLMRHDDPRSGSITTTVTQINRADPDPALFGVPSDYRVMLP